MAWCVIYDYLYKCRCVNVVIRNFSRSLFYANTQSHIFLCIGIVTFSVHSFADDCEVEQSTDAISPQQIKNFEKISTDLSQNDFKHELNCDGQGNLTSVNVDLEYQRQYLLFLKAKKFLTSAQLKAADLIIKNKDANQYAQFFSSLSASEKIPLFFPYKTPYAFLNKLSIQSDSTQNSCVQTLSGREVDFILGYSKKFKQDPFLFLTIGLVEYPQDKISAPASHDYHIVRALGCDLKKGGVARNKLMSQKLDYYLQNHPHFQKNFTQIEFNYRYMCIGDHQSWNSLNTLTRELNPQDSPFDWGKSCCIQFSYTKAAATPKGNWREDGFWNNRVALSVISSPEFIQQKINGGLKVADAFQTFNGLNTLSGSAGSGWLVPPYMRGINMHQDPLYGESSLSVYENSVITNPILQSRLQKSGAYPSILCKGKKRGIYPYHTESRIDSIKKIARMEKFSKQNKVSCSSVSKAEQFLVALDFIDLTIKQTTNQNVLNTQFSETKNHACELMQQLSTLKNPEIEKNYTYKDLEASISKFCSKAPKPEVECGKKTEAALQYYKDFLLPSLNTVGKANGVFSDSRINYTRFTDSEISGYHLPEKNCLK